MRFLFVNRIDSMSETTISGHHYFAPDEPLQYPLHSAFDGFAGNQVAPGVVSEAIGQLASWLAIKQNGFTARPVFLFADKISVEHPVAPGTGVELRAEIHQLDAEILVFSGSALVDGRMVQAVSNCSGYFMPLDQLEDPAVTKERFASLVAGGLLLDAGVSSRYPFENLCEEIVDQDGSSSIVVRRTMRHDEPFYRDHFPRFPVTPIVMLNELIGAAAKAMMNDKKSGSEHSDLYESGKEIRLFPRCVADVKIKSFVKPGESCLVKVRTQNISIGIVALTTITGLISFLMWISKNSESESDDSF